MGERRGLEQKVTSHVIFLMQQNTLTHPLQPLMCGKKVGVDLLDCSCQHLALCAANLNALQTTKLCRFGRVYAQTA